MHDHFGLASPALPVCPICHGTGVEVLPEIDPRTGKHRTHYPCAECNGTGRTRNAPLNWMTQDDDERRATMDGT